MLIIDKLLRFSSDQYAKLVLVLEYQLMDSNPDRKLEHDLHQLNLFQDRQLVLLKEKRKSMDPIENKFVILIVYFIRKIIILN